MTSAAFSFGILFLIANLGLSSGNRNAFVEDRKCGVLYSEKNYSGNAFFLKDFDQSVNTKTDYRTSVYGWQKTGSIQIEENCAMNVCTEPYFQGTCHSFPAGQHQDSQFTENINSANCTCARDCNCEDIHIPKSSRSCGRAYPTGNCKKCDSKYVYLSYSDGHWIFPVTYSDSIESIVLRTGCNLTVWSGDHYKEGEVKVITGPLATDPGKIENFECECDDAAYVPPERPKSYPPLVELPETKEQLISLLSSDLTATTHPGYQAAYKSAKNGRSSRNAYVVLIGYPNSFWIGLGSCFDGNMEIGECHYPINLDKLGVSNARLGVIYVNVAGPYDKGQEADGRWAATLADYLSNHEDLRDSIPNAVFLYHFNVSDSLIEEKSCKFQRKLKVLDLLRPLLVDENYSNIVFFLEGLDYLNITEQKNPEIIERFKVAITGKWSFPEPIFIVPRSDWSFYQPIINGYWRMMNGEYNFMNLQKTLKIISENGGDPLGHAIFDSAYPIEKQNKWVLQKRIDVFSSNKNKVKTCQNSSTTWIENHAKLKLGLQAKTLEMIAQYENRNNSQINGITEQSSMKIVINKECARKMDETRQITAEMNKEILAKIEMIAKMKEEIEQLKTLLDEEKLTGKADINNTYNI